MKKKLIFCFDIDNTICETKGTNYSSAKPKKKVINLINKLYEKGHTIKIFTGRYMGANNNNIKNTYKTGYKSTFKQLNKWKLKYHKLILGKPTFDILIDDKALGFKNSFILSLKRYLK
tara:strand:- start:425 stop:778 length:354 start_codon:yes stop_codon:yes gene_type:complete